MLGENRARAAAGLRIMLGANLPAELDAAFRQQLRQEAGGMLRGLFDGEDEFARLAVGRENSGDEDGLAPGSRVRRRSGFSLAEM